jgi:hypothetical protein
MSFKVASLLKIGVIPTPSVLLWSRISTTDGFGTRTFARSLDNAQRLLDAMLIHAELGEWALASYLQT